MAKSKAPRRGRPPKVEGGKAILVTIAGDDWEWMRRRAFEERTSVNDLVREAVSAFRRTASAKPTGSGRS